MVTKALCRSLLLYGIMVPSLIVQASVVVPSPDRAIIDRELRKLACPGALPLIFSELQEILKRESSSVEGKAYALEKLGALARQNGRKEYSEYLLSIYRTPQEDPRLDDLREHALWEFVLLSEGMSGSGEAHASGLAQYLNAQIDGGAAKIVQMRAADELCSQGRIEYLSDIEEVMRRYDQSRALQYFDICKGKAILASSHRVREEALLAGLKSEDSEAGRAIAKWAVTELGELTSERSTEILMDVALGKVVAPNQSTQQVRAIRGLSERGWNFERLKVLGVDERLLVRAGLYPGSDLSEEELAQLCAEVATQLTP